MRDWGRSARFAAVAAAGVLTLLALGPGSARAASGGTWVGPVQGTGGAFVAIVSDGDQVVAYVCDNGTIGSWFFGADGSADHVQLVSRDHSLLDVTFGDSAVGTFLHDGQVYSFKARATDKTVLFRADATARDGSPVLGGWIQNGSESRGTLSIGGALQTAPSLTTNIVFPPLNLTLAPAPMTPDTLAASTANTTKFVWGAMGDSYGSGEGDPEHGINDPTNVGNFTGLSWGNDSSIFVPNGSASLAADVTTCHRSDRAGAPRANAELKSEYPGMTFALGFVACSGAHIFDLEQGGYKGPDVTPESMLGFAKVTQPAQLDRIETFTAAQGQLDALYMSIGGNDAGFGQLIKDCITPYPLGPLDCSQSDEPLLASNLMGLEAKYDILGSDINGLFATLPALPQVLISGYPNPLDGGSDICHGSDYNGVGEVGGPLSYDDALQSNVTSAEATWAFNIPARLNSAVSTASIFNGWWYVDTHLSAFAGHGVCTTQPFANLNSKALRRQGQDIPGTFPLAFSSGFMHPNDAGFGAYADAISGVLETFVDQRAKTGLVAPTNVRIGAATANGAITVRWNDRSTSENGDDVEVLPARTQDAALITVPAGAVAIAGGGFRIRVSGVGVEQFVHQVNGGGRFLYRVRACQSGINGNADAECGPWSAQINGTNVAPAAPTGLHVSSQFFNTGGKLGVYDVVGWNAQPDAIEFVVRVVAGDGSFSDIRTSSTSLTLSPGLNTTYRVAACNRVGCSGFAS